MVEFIRKISHAEVGRVAWESEGAERVARARPRGEVCEVARRPRSRRGRAGPGRVCPCRENGPACEASGSVDGRRQVTPDGFLGLPVSVIKAFGKPRDDGSSKTNQENGLP